MSCWKDAGVNLVSAIGGCDKIQELYINWHIPKKKRTIPVPFFLSVLLCKQISNFYKQKLFPFALLGGSF